MANRMIVTLKDIEKFGPAAQAQIRTQLGMTGSRQPKAKVCKTNHPVINSMKLWYAIPVLIGVWCIIGTMY